jgi:hypothetical protein
MEMGRLFWGLTPETWRAKARLDLGVFLVPRPEGRGNISGVIATSFSSWTGMGKQSWGFNP